MDLAVQPHVLKDMVLTIDADNYAGHVSLSRLSPSTEVPKLTWQGLSPAAAFSEAGSVSTSWDWSINAAQDWTSAKSLSQYLYDHAGETKEVTLTPQRGEGKTFTFTVTIVPGEIGGEVNTVATAAVTMPVDGKPTMATTTPEVP